MTGGEVVRQAQRTNSSARAYYHQGNYRQAIDCSKQAVAALDGMSPHERFGVIFLPAVNSRVWSPGAMPNSARSPKAGSSGKKGCALPRRLRTPQALRLPITGLVCWSSARAICPGHFHYSNEP